MSAPVERAGSSAAEGRVVEHAEGFSCELPGGGRALFTSRAHGNLSTRAGDGHGRGREARDRLCAELGQDWLCASRQVHGTSVQRVRTVTAAGGEPVSIDADGHATALHGVGAMVLSADCLPVALGGDGVVAMVHAGWRGLAAGVLEQGLDALRELGASGPIEAVVGPAAGVCCYEVGPEVHAAFGQDSFDAPYRAGNNIDLRAIAREQLLALGVAQVHDAAACTICDERFFSHRREGERAGRQGGIAWLG
jgi:purine-nucleoside/S-methyl-5'-thioadenosine phosphorylase / adenosine deaminase